MTGVERRIASVILFLMLPLAARVSSQIAVKYKEGLTHGFLVLRTLEGETLADGDLIQSVREDRVTSRLVFHFKDGSLHDETAIFSQRKNFRLLSDHLVQKGPAFQHPVDMHLNATTGEVNVQYVEDGKEKTNTEHLRLPPDVANGMVYILMKNIDPNAPQTTFGYVGAAPKPRVVKLVVTPQGEDDFTLDGGHRKARHYVVKVEIGGLTGALADILGKKPADTHVWLLEGEAPTFVKSEGLLAIGGPTWRIELISPVWPHKDSTHEENSSRK